ncbi:hypothetical protein SAMN04488543_1609 [Friedmanniella luteola]|uniref:Lipoprotein n=1 Tax=Friedmanniella luteola TaxID=546871 RepID=A0A1H1RP22_9ACTN|nr:DUF6624 domain-containing protein [Friedmanniella luteola]SDS37454.1 hypothetical protein SAMN04488543_1609 [Friedmanniella luteola]
MSRLAHHLCGVALVLVLVLSGCAAGDVPGADAPGPTSSGSPSARSASPTPAPVRTAATDPRLRTELLAMLAADQEDRQGDGQGGVGGDQERTERLRDIVDERGWPTQTLVGDDGATAAWVIAQHSDLDPAFQREVLALMRPAVAAGEADPGDLAYLVDRVAANAGQPQTYGTQTGCSDDGEPQRPPLTDPERVDQLRAEAGLPPLAEYLAEMEKVCAGS